MTDRNAAASGTRGRHRAGPARYTEAARAELIAALESARGRGAEYDVAATIDALRALGGADADLLRERDEILSRLKIVRLPTPAFD